MNCDDCLNHLEEYIDGELAEREAEKIGAHLIACARCSNEFEALTAEQEIYARYDRELEVSPAMWNAIAARTMETRPIVSTSRFSLRAWTAGLFVTPRYGFAGAMAVLIAAVVIGVMYLRTQKQAPPPSFNAKSATVTPAISPDIVAEVKQPSTEEATTRPGAPSSTDQQTIAARTSSPGSKRVSSARQADDVLFIDVAYSDLENKDTAEHIQQAQNLLRSIRNIQLSDDDEEVDVTYEKATSRRLLNDNVILRRDAEASGKFPVKTLLGDLEPFLVDIANLPDKTTPNDLRAIKDRVQKTEIVAALQSY
jgi:anti-sigma factor RsiW